MNKAIVCEGLTKSYGNKNALDRLGFSIDENKIIGLIGRNGAGKTTFLKTCAGYLLPTSGEVRINGENPFDNLNVLSDMVFIDEEVQYDTGFKLKDILALGKAAYENWDDAFAEKLIKYFKLDGNQKYRKLSRGMKTQFNIIMGLACRAKLTLMDEPTLGLDAAVRKEFYKILLKDYMEHPRTIVISSHLLSEIENLLEEIVLIDEGRLVLHETLEKLQNYAVYLNGGSERAKAFIQKKKVLNVDEFGNSYIAAIENDLNEDEKEFLAGNNIDVSRVKVEDVCIYLTKQGKGGGFDAFEG